MDEPQRTPNSEQRVSPDGSSAPSAGEAFRRLGAAGPLALAALLLPPLGGLVILGTLTEVGPWLRSHEEAGVALYVAVFMITSGLALLPTYSQAILGGWAFGLAWGFPAALAGFLGGAVIGYIVARVTGAKSMDSALRHNPKWSAVREALVGSGFWRTLGMVTLLRLPPNSPFALSNVVYGTTRVAPAPYMLGTLAGMAPRTFVAVWLADGLRSLTIDEARKQDMPTWVFVSGGAVAAAALVVVGVVANRAVKRMTTAPGRGAKVGA